MNASRVDRVVIITGGSGGIGKAIAAAFAHAGAQTVMVARNQSALNATADAIANAGALRPDIIATDLRAEDGCKAVFD